MSDAAPAAPIAAAPVSAPAADSSNPAAVVDTGGGSVAREWMGTLPGELQTDPTLSRYENVEAISRAFLEQKKELGSRLHIPAADASPEEWGKTWDALGRPADVADYDVPVLDGMDPASTQPFRELAHGLGLNVAQAKGAVEFYNQMLTDAKTQAEAASVADLQTLKDEWGGDYAAKEAAASSAFKRVFGDDGAAADKLVQIMGDATAVRGFAALAEMIGEHGRVDGAVDPISGIPDNAAQGRLDELMKDEGWRERYNKGDATTVGEYNRLLTAATRHANSQN